MYFDHIHPISSQLLSYPSPITLCLLPFFLFSFKHNPLAPFTPKYGHILLSVGPSTRSQVTDLPGAIALKKLILSPPETINCLFLLSYGCYLTNSSLFHVRVLASLVLCRQIQLLWTHECSSPIISRRCINSSFFGMPTLKEWHSVFLLIMKAWS